MREDSKQKLESVLNSAKDGVLNASKWIEDLYLVKKAGEPIYTLMHKGKAIMRVVNGEINNILLDAREDYYKIVSSVFPEIDKIIDSVDSKVEEVIEDAENDIKSVEESVIKKRKTKKTNADKSEK